MWRRRTIAERQKRLDRIVRILEYLSPIVVSAVAATMVNLMVLR